MIGGCGCTGEGTQHHCSTVFYCHKYRMSSLILGMFWFWFFTVGGEYVCRDLGDSFLFSSFSHQMSACA